LGTYGFSAAMRQTRPCGSRVNNRRIFRLDSTTWRNRLLNLVWTMRSVLVVKAISVVTTPIADSMKGRAMWKWKDVLSPENRNIGW